MAERLEFELKAIDKQFQDSIKNAKKSIKGLENGFSKLAKASGAALAGLTAAIGGAVNEAAKIETITTQFEVLTGSVLGARKAVQQLQEFSASTPFSFEQVSTAGRQLLAFGFSVEELTPRLQQLGDVAAASGNSVGELTTIYGQVAAAGKLTGERLLQLQERAIPIGPALASTLGVAESAVRDLVSQGKVSFKDFEAAFASLNKEGNFAFGGLEKVSGTLEGKISTLKDNFSLLASEFGAQFLPAAKQATQALIDLFGQIRQNPELIQTAARFARITVGALAIATAVGIAGVALAKIAAVFVTVGGAVAGLVAFFNPLTLAISAIGAVVGALVLKWTGSFDKLESIANGFVERIKTLFSGLGNLLNAALSFDGAGIKDALNEIEAAFLSSTQAMEARKAEIEQNRERRKEKELESEKDKNEQLLEEFQAASDKRLEIKDQENEKKLTKDEEELLRKLGFNAEAQEILREQKDELNQQEQIQLAEHLERLDQNKTEAIAKEITARKKQRKKDMKIEQDYGKTFLAFQKALNTESFKNASTLAAQNVNLARSENQTISSIGKAAAITQIGTDAAKGAMAVFAKSVDTFPPPAGPIIGGALAAAQLAYGAERIAQVRGAQMGGLVEGIGPGDTNPFMLERGELVVPRKNFDEVVSDAAARQQAQEEGESATTSGGVQEVIIGFKDDAFEIIEEKILERRDAGVGVI